MNLTKSAITLAALAALAFNAAAAEDGFKSLFNGKDLTGWAGRPEHWSVQDGAITGTTRENPAKGNNFLIAKDGDKNLIVSDFELRLSYKIIANNEKNFGDSGIQYRSKELPDFVVSGYQANLMVTKPLTGILYEEKGRGIIHQLGQKVVIKADPDEPKKHKIEVVGSFGKSEEIQASFKKDDWNDYVVIAKGNHLQHFINGVQTADVTDEDEARAAKSGILALQLHAGPPMTVQFKNIRIKTLGGGAQFDGAWKVVEGTVNGQAAPREFLDSVTVVIEGKAYRTTVGSETDSGKFTVDESKSPKAMDIEPSRDGAPTIPAIYEFDGETLRVAYATKGARPTEFKSEADSGVVVFTYKRK